VDTDAVSRLVAGRSVSHLDRTPSGAVVVHFADGARLTVYARDDELAITFGTDGQRRSLAKPGQPSARQREYSSSSFDTWQGSVSRRLKGISSGISWSPLHPLIR